MVRTIVIILAALNCYSQPAVLCDRRSDRHWDGFNPFEAPSRTTDYHGSGDIDLDGHISSEDVRLLEEMLAGSRTPNVRADVDGNGVVDQGDLALLEQAATGGTLPGWWNCLRTVEQRVQWVGRVMTLDFNRLIGLREADSDWVCTQYAERCFLRFTPQVLDSSNPRYRDYGISQHTFNLPLYIATITTTNFGHSLNALLTGEDPSAFTNWLFLEPQTGGPARTGERNMPWGAQVHIQMPGSLNAPYPSYLSLADFQLTRPAPVLVACHSNLLLRRPIADATGIQNQPNVWHPTVLAEGDGMLLFDKDRDDLGRVTDLHLLASLSGDPNQAQALVNAEGFSRLSSTAPAGPSCYHLLWVGRTNRQEGLFYGKLETRAGVIYDQRMIATNAFEGQVLGLGTNEAYVFYPTDLGLTCLHKQADQWSPPEEVLRWTALPFKIAAPCFGVTITSNREPWVIWSDETTQDCNYQTTLFETRRHEGWQPPHALGTLDGFVPSLKVASDRAGTLHLVYTSTWYPEFTCATGTLSGELWQVVRGSIFYCSRDQAGWTQPRTVATDSFWPTLAITKNDEVILAWETDVDGHVAPVWTDHTAQTPPTICATKGTPYYPTLTEMASGAVLLAWNEVSQRGAAANYQMVRAPEAITLSLAARAGWVQIKWQARTSGTFQIESKEALGASTWQRLGPSFTSQTNSGSLCFPMQQISPIGLYRMKRL